MFAVDDLVVYSGHGICKIIDITELTFSNMTRSYYVLEPLENPQDLTIKVPVDTKKVMIAKLIDKQEAEEILESFKLPGVDWIEKPNQRTHAFSTILKSGNRKEIAKVANTLLRKRKVLEGENRKFYEQDSWILQQIEDVLFHELAIAMDITNTEVMDRIVQQLKMSPEVNVDGAVSE